MKKIVLSISIIVVILLAAFVVFTQSSKSQKIDETIKKDIKNVIELKFAHHMPSSSTLHKTAMHFAKEVERKSEGRVKISVYPNQELGNSHKMVELSRLGQIDIVLTATAKMSVVVPSMQYADLPFIFPTKDDAHKLLDGKVGEMLLKDLDTIDLLGVTFWEGGFKNFTSNKPLENIEDFKDLNVRVMKCRVIMEQYNALDANPITIDFHATKKALKDGVVDAQENPLCEIVTMGFYDVQNNITLSEHSYLPYVLTFSKKSLSKLPLDVQNILIQSAKEATIWNRKKTIEKDKELLDVIKKAGLKLHRLSPDQKGKLIDATSYIKKKYEDTIGSHIISKSEEYFYNQSDKSNIVAIGVDADLSRGAKGSGLAIKRGVELAVNEINKNGGLLGKHVVVVAKDHKGTSTQAEENINEFINDKNIIGVIGGKHSAIISSYTKNIQDNNLIFFSPWAAATSVTENGYKENYIFRVSLNDRYATKFLVQEALKKGKKPAIIVENSIWGKEALKNINSYLEQNGLKKQDGFIINRGEKGFGKVFNEILNRDYDSIIMVLNSQEAQRVVAYMGKNSIKLPIISHWGIVGDAFFDANKEYLKSMDLSFIQTFSLVDNDKKETKDLVENYLKTYHKSSADQINAITGVVQAYDAVMLLANAIQKCGSFDPKKVKESLENLTIYNGVIKSYKNPFSAKDHDALATEDFIMAKFDKNGNIVPIKE